MSVSESQLAERLAWWKTHLEGSSSIQLPTDYARPLNKAFVEREEILEPSPGA